MITGFLLKIVIGIAVIGFIAVEGGSPLITRAQVDGAAHDAAEDAAADYFHTKNEESARLAAETIAAKEDATLESFTIDANGKVDVTLVKQARSIVMKKISATKSWYEIRVSASAERK